MNAYASKAPAPAAPRVSCPCFLDRESDVAGRGEKTLVNVPDTVRPGRSGLSPVNQMNSHAATQAVDLSALQRERARPKKTAKKLDASLQWMQSWSTSLKHEFLSFRVV